MRSEGRTTAARNMLIAPITNPTSSATQNRHGLPFDVAASPAIWISASTRPRVICHSAMMLLGTPVVIVLRSARLNRESASGSVCNAPSTFSVHAAQRPAPQQIIGITAIGIAVLGSATSAPVIAIGIGILMTDTLITTGAIIMTGTTIGTETNQAGMAPFAGVILCGCEAFRARSCVRQEFAQADAAAGPKSGIGARTGLALV